MAQKLKDLRIDYKGFGSRISVGEIDTQSLAMKVAANGSLVKFNMIDGMLDDFQDTSGVDASNSIDDYRNAANYYSGAQAGAISGTGGFAATNYTSGTTTFRVVTFNSTGTLIVAGTLSGADTLLVAGGGGGGGSSGCGGGGGGGGGGLLYGDDKAYDNGTYNVTVGAGGGGGNTSSNDEGVRGGDTVIAGVSPNTWGTATADGGGSGGSCCGPGVAGGSGGGRGSAPGTQGNSNGLTGFGNDGVGGPCSNGSPSGGGSGAGSQGNGGHVSYNGTNHNHSPGTAGSGKSYDIDGTGRTYSHGGGAANAGTGGGGGGSANTGGGGGGSGSNSGAGDGGTGKVILRYTDSQLGDLFNNMTLISTSNTASTAPTAGDIVVQYSLGEGTTAINTDLKGFISMDNGSTYTEVTLVAETTWGTKYIAAARNVTLTSTSGTSMRYKVTTHNQAAGTRETRIDAVSMAWR